MSSGPDQPGGFPMGGGPGGPGGFGEPGAFDLSALMAQAQQMQQQLMSAQQQLADTQVTGSAGGGLVRATVTGAGEVVGLDIDPSAIDPSDAEGLADLVLAAIRDATRAAAEMQEQAMGPLTQGLPNMPGMPGLPGLPGMPGAGQ